MAITILNSSSDSLSSQAVSWTFDFSGDFTSDGDNVMILMVTLDANTLINEPDGWTNAISNPASSSTTSVFIKDPQLGNAPISSVFIESSSADGHWSANIYELDGVNLPIILDVAGFIAYTSDETSYLAQTLTTNNDGGMLFTGAGTNNSPIVTLDGAITAGESSKSSSGGVGVGQTSGYLQLGVAGQIQAITHTVDFGTDAVCYSVVINAASAAPQPSLHTVKLDKQCESTDFALGMLAIKNQSTTNEIASSIVSLSNLPTDTPQFNITYATGAPVFANGDTIHLYYDSSTGDIKSTADGIDLASFTNLLGDTCP